MSRDDMRDLALLVAGVVLVGAVALLFLGPMVSSVYSHCTETPPPDSGIVCQSYGPPLQNP